MDLWIIYMPFGWTQIRRVIVEAKLMDKMTAKDIMRSKCPILSRILPVRYRIMNGF